MKRLLGFTLTELMIAITVLGVLTAAVLPAVLGNNPNQNKVMMKKAYFTTAEVVSEMINNESLFARYGEDGTDYATQQINSNPHIGILNNNDYVNFDGHTITSNKRIQIFSGMINPKIGSTAWGGISGAPNHVDCNAIVPTGSSQGTAWYGTTTKDGMDWCFVDKGGIMKILVDVNGDTKPNCYEGTTTGKCAGRTENFDQFRMDVYPDGAIVIDSRDTWAKKAISISATLSD